MSEGDREIEDLQVEVAALLLDFVYAPLLEDQHVRGVLPAPLGAPAVRVVIGDKGECAPGRLTAYEIPLRAGEELRTAHDVVALLRAAHTGTHIYPANRVSSVMSMDLYPFQHGRLGRHPPAMPRPAVRGPGRLAPARIPVPGRRSAAPYMDSDDGPVPDVIAADVRPGGALTALPAALPSLLGEEWRTTDAVDDPHCRYRVDLTDW
ncbi:hypothetical protein ACH4OT_35885 [Streptomyces murinus]|uniref:hypothetical protein n=1 Tax=Streptomyces murinus TaxID=33900 RepID=UPI0037A4AD68